MSQCAHYEFRCHFEARDGDAHSVMQIISREEIIAWCKENCREWAFQLEKSDGDYKHYQGHCVLSKKRRINENKTATPLPNGKWFNYWQPTCNTVHSQITSKGCKAFYATKRDTRIEGPWSSEDVDDYVPIQYRGHTKRRYQQQIFDNCRVFNSRIVNVLIDMDGKLGKTTTVELAIQEGLKVFEIENVHSYKDIRRECFDLLFKAQERSPDVFFIDLPRAMRHEVLTDIYAAIEKIKDGKAKTDRYNSGNIWKFDSPAVWVMTNIIPSSLNGLSADRWRFWTVEGEELVARSYGQIKNMKPKGQE